MGEGTEATEHAWDRASAGWHLAFVVFATATGLLVLHEPATPPERKALVLVLLAALCAAYACLGAGELHGQPRRPRGMAYVAVAAPLSLAMFAVMPLAAVMLFALYPHIWCLLPTRPAVWATAATSATVGVVIVVTDGPRTWGVALLIVVLGLVLALVLGLWIGMIIDQSAERARLAADLAATRNELAIASREAGVLAERERLARDLHDTVAQGSISVLMMLRTARKSLGRDPGTVERHLELAERTTRESLGEIRALVAALAPTRLGGVTLREALCGLADDLRQETGVAAHVSVTGDDHTLALSHEVVLLRAAQEALANVRRHARATRVEIDLAYHDDRVTLRVSDDGRGFDPRRQPGFGLDGLRSRVAEAAGDFDIDTAVSAGTTLTVGLPTGER